MRRSAQLLLALLTGCLLTGCGATATNAATTLTSHGGHVRLANASLRLVNLRAGGRERSYLLYVPAGDSRRHRLPLVLVYHGAYDTAAGTVAETGLVARDQRRHDMILAFLQGYQDSWNDDAGEPPAERAHVKDIAFSSAVIKQVERRYAVNRRRVIATGFSNGAILVELLGCRIASQLTMVVPVEGQMGSRFAGSCAPRDPISVFEIHATGDQSIPYKGGTFAGYGGPVTVLSAPASIKRWASLNGCSGTARHARSGIFHLRTYGGCHRRVRITLATIDGGSHEWPPGFAATLGRVVDSAPQTRAAAVP